MAALIQYFLLSAFCWMMCEGVMLYLMLVVVFSRLKEKWWFFFMLGWGKYCMDTEWLNACTCVCPNFLFFIDTHSFFKKYMIKSDFLATLNIEYSDAHAPCMQCLRPVKYICCCVTIFYMFEPRPNEHVLIVFLLQGLH